MLANLVPLFGQLKLTNVSQFGPAVYPQNLNYDFCSSAGCCRVIQKIQIVVAYVTPGVSMGSLKHLYPIWLSRLAAL